MADTSLRRLRSVGAAVWRASGSAGRRLVRGGADEAALPRPIFIVGCGHSGTTLLLSMLSAHSRVYGVPYESSLASYSPGSVDWFVRRFNREARRAGKARWVEKTPRHVHAIPWLLRRFPDAAIVVMLRDGRDVACSLRDRTGDLDMAIRRWLDDNAAAESQLDHPSVHLVRYEELVGDPRRALTDLLATLGEEFEPAMLHHEQSGFRFLGRWEGSGRMRRAIEDLEHGRDTPEPGDHRLYRSWQARQPVFDGRGRWKECLDAGELAKVEELAGAKLTEYGYRDA